MMATLATVMMVTMGNTALIMVTRTTMTATRMPTSSVTLTMITKAAMTVMKVTAGGISLTMIKKAATTKVTTTILSGVEKVVVMTLAAAVRMMGTVAGVKSKSTSVDQGEVVMDPDMDMDVDTDMDVDMDMDAGRKVNN